jgi:hypothetical protein
VRKTLEIIDSFPDCPYFLENPGTGLLRTREVIAGRPSHKLTYCRYATGNYPKYRKLTQLWANTDWWAPRPVCRKRNHCEWSDEEGKPSVYAQRRVKRLEGRVVPGAEPRASSSSTRSRPRWSRRSSTRGPSAAGTERACRE